MSAHTEHSTEDINRSRKKTTEYVDRRNTEFREKISPPISDFNGLRAAAGCDDAPGVV